MSRAMAPAWKPDTFPRGVLIGGAAMIAFAMTAALAGRLTGIGTVHVQPGPVSESVALRFEDRQDGAVLVRTAEDGRVVDVLAPNTNHFVRATVRGLVRTRKREGIDAGPPFRLSRYADGRTALVDEATGRRIELDAFGRSNASAFSVIMEAARKP